MPPTSAATGGTRRRLAAFTEEVASGTLTPSFSINIISGTFPSDGFSGLSALDEALAGLHALRAVTAGENASLAITEQLVEFSGPPPSAAGSFSFAGYLLQSPLLYVELPDESFKPDFASAEKIRFLLNGTAGMLGSSDVLQNKHILARFSWQNLVLPLQQSDTANLPHAAPCSATLPISDAAPTCPSGGTGDGRGDTLTITLPDFASGQPIPLGSGTDATSTGFRLIRPPALFQDPGTKCYEVCVCQQ